MSSRVETGAVSGGCTQKILKFDLYGRPFMFMLPNHEQRYKSIVGSLCTILVLFIVFVYAVYKVQLLSDKDESRVQRTLEENYFDYKKSVSNKEGAFNVAFSLASYEAPNEFLTDYESYGRLRLIYHLGSLASSSSSQSGNEAHSNPSLD